MNLKGSKGETWEILEVEDTGERNGVLAAISLLS